MKKIYYELKFHSLCTAQTQISHKSAATDPWSGVIWAFAVSPSQHRRYTHCFCNLCKECTSNHGIDLQLLYQSLVVLGQGYRDDSGRHI